MSIIGMASASEPKRVFEKPFEQGGYIFIDREPLPMIDISPDGSTRNRWWRDSVYIKKGDSTALICSTSWVELHSFIGQQPMYYLDAYFDNEIIMIAQMHGTRVGLKCWYRDHHSYIEPLNSNSAGILFDSAREKHGLPSEQMVFDGLFEFDSKEKMVVLSLGRNFKVAKPPILRWRIRLESCGDAKLLRVSKDE
ncbi:MAG TPA: hypothetical protein VF624_13685 [Tepidisphaeraceae bacterium]|jgi:hypothetical protein